MTEQMFTYLRELAKNNYYQTIYNQMKEVHHLKLFENERNLSDIQLQFLGFLNFYANLFLDCALGEIEDIIFTDKIYEDAYMYYKHNKKEDSNENLKSKDLKHPTGQPHKGNSQENFQWVFKRPTKEVT